MQVNICVSIYLFSIYLFRCPTVQVFRCASELLCICPENNFWKNLTPILVESHA